MQVILNTGNNRKTTYVGLTEPWKQQKDKSRPQVLQNTGNYFLTTYVGLLEHWKLKKDNLMSLTMLETIVLEKPNKYFVTTYIIHRYISLTECSILSAKFRLLIINILLLTNFQGPDFIMILVSKLQESVFSFTGHSSQRSLRCARECLCYLQ